MCMFLGNSSVMDLDGYTFVFFIKNNQYFSHKNARCIMIILFNHFRMEVFALFKLKENNITPFYRPYISIK